MPAAAATYPHPPRVLSFRTGDVDEFMGILAKHHTPTRAEPLQPSSFALECNIVATGGICVSRAVYPTGVELGFETTFDGYGLSLPTSGPFEVIAAGGGVHQPKRGCGLMMDSRDIVGAVMGAGMTLPRISVTTLEMHERLAELIDHPAVHRVQFAPDVPLNSPSAHMASTLTQLISRGMEGDAPLLQYPVALSSLREAVLNLLLEAFPNSYSDQILARSSPTTPAHVRRAMEFILAHASQPLRLADIAKAAGTSARSLQSGFMQFRGVTPMAYLRTVRLNAVRAELLLGRPGTTVAHTAYVWGFAHLSSFSAKYLQAFGERPSETLLRASNR